MSSAMARPRVRAGVATSSPDYLLALAEQERMKASYSAPLRSIPQGPSCSRAVGPTGDCFVRKDAPGYGSTHFALSVSTNAAMVKAIAERAGWQCFDCNRGPFHVIEVWLENETMVEILPPEYAREYLAFSRSDNVKAAMAAASTASARERQA
jgi:hypothetical protein